MGKEVEEERLQSWGGRAAWGKLGEGRTDEEKNRPVTHVQRERERDDLGGGGAKHESH